MGYIGSLDVQHEAVEKVLKTYLKGDALNSAVSLWDRQYSGQSFEKLSFFVFEIATTSTLRNLRKNILEELEQNLKISNFDSSAIQFNTLNKSNLTESKPNTTRPKYIPPNNSMTKGEDISETNRLFDQLKVEDFKARVAESRRRVAAGSVIDPNTLLEFIQMLRVLLDKINRADLVHILSEYLAQAELPEFIQQDVYEVVLRQGEDLLRLPYDANYIRSVINILYSISCEYHGPVKTDRMMTKAITTLEQKYPLENLRQFL